MNEPIRELNGVRLTVGQAMTLRCAIESFSADLRSNGLGDDEIGKDICQGYLNCIDQLRAIIYT